ncbi:MULTISPECIES: DUF2716 domain-containing protein [Leptospira]|uniref:DUF2716 domain-containing protein n=1 Tax=Leptospira kanakyensis TaxID=2484968 RepID=A0A6N4Q995_9LEPT|nr:MULTISPECIES: DUF2716 domain-containing protein [Leptospira]MCG6142745.1 DUF2716 domain-containing protein [Leptospira mtsangambouensis]TGK55732.1 DUF2716 domain-containing protein [Leptospira kanakyensis]TGK76987.1 DUF2716 domain-containing protein [Leptospira kanakyensis]
MKDWKKLDSKESNSVWDKFEEKYQFKPSVSEFPGIIKINPQLKLDLSECYHETFNNTEFENIASDLFKNITKPNERMYALDWQHESYDFDPRNIMDRNDKYDEWLIPIFPNGDYYIFITKDFNNLWFGHPWEQTITLVGNDLIKFSNKIISKFSEIGIRLL